MNQQTPSRSPKAEFVHLCLRYHLHRSFPKSEPAPGLIHDLMKFGERQKIKIKKPLKVDDLFLKGLFDIEKTLPSKSSRWFEFKEELGSREKLLGRWKKNLKREQRYEIYVEAARSLGKINHSSVISVLGEFQQGLGLEPDECDRLRRGKNEGHRLVKASVYRLLSAEVGEKGARAFITKRFHLTPNTPEILHSGLQSKSQPLIRGVSMELNSLLSKSHLSDTEKAHFLRLSEKLRTSDKFKDLDDLSYMLLLKPLLTHRSKLRHHSMILREMRSWLRKPLPEVTDIASKLNLFLPLFGEKTLMDRKLADVLELLYGKRRPHFPDPGEDFRRDYYVYLQFLIAKSGKDLKIFAANVIRPVEEPLGSSAEEFCYDLLKNYVFFRQQESGPIHALEMSREGEKEFFSILKELKISRGEVMKALKLLLVHHHVHLRLPSSQICVPF